MDPFLVILAAYAVIENFARRKAPAIRP